MITDGFTKMETVNKEVQAPPPTKVSFEEQRRIVKVEKIQPTPAGV